MEKTYINWIKRFILFHDKNRNDDILTSLAVDSEVTASTQNQALNALAFLYRPGRYWSQQEMVSLN